MVTRLFILNQYRMSVALYYNQGFLPFTPIIGVPPANYGYNIGLTTQEIVKEYWLSKNIECTWTWTYIPNIDPTETIYFNGSAAGPSLGLYNQPLTGAPTSIPSTPWSPAIRTNNNLIGLGNGLSLNYNAYSTGSEAEEANFGLAIIWGGTYWDKLGTGLYYPRLLISVGGTGANNVTNIGSVVCPGYTCSVFGKTVSPMYDDTTGIDGGTKTGNTTIISSSYWS